MTNFGKELVKSKAYNITMGCFRAILWTLIKHVKTVIAKNENGVNVAKQNVIELCYFNLHMHYTTNQRTILGQFHGTQFQPFKAEMESLPLNTRTGGIN